MLLVLPDGPWLYCWYKSAGRLNIDIHFLSSPCLSLSLSPAVCLFDLHFALHPAHFALQWNAHGLEFFFFFCCQITVSTNRSVHRWWNSERWSILLFFPPSSLASFFQYHWPLVCHSNNSAALNFPTPSSSSSPHVSLCFYRAMYQSQLNSFLILIFSSIISMYQIRNRQGHPCLLQMPDNFVLWRSPPCFSELMRGKTFVRPVGSAARQGHVGLS